MITKANPKNKILKPEVRTIEGRIILNKIDEVTLYILCEFKFIPIWLIKQWYQIYNLDGYESVQTWIQFGLAWCEPTSLGVYIRPTMFLLNVIYDDNDGDKSFIGLPFNLMNHTCAEEQLMFDVMMGNPESEFWLSFKKAHIADKLPCYHPMYVNDYDPNDNEGALIIGESRFRADTFDSRALTDGHEKVRREMKEKASGFTSEFTTTSENSPNNWPLFTLECGGMLDRKGNAIIDKNGNLKIETQRPDLAIPMPRKDGKPQSYAIEMELTAKNMARYEKIMSHYQNNDIYGALVYLCGNEYIAKLVRQAFNNVNGLGHCQLFIIPYAPPAQMLADFSLDDLNSQYGLLKTTASKTNLPEKKNEKT